MCSNQSEHWDSLKMKLQGMVEIKEKSKRVSLRGWSNDDNDSCRKLNANNLASNTNRNNGGSAYALKQK